MENWRASGIWNPLENALSISEWRRLAQTAREEVFIRFGKADALIIRPIRIVLLKPEIPPNTGNIARLCAATKTFLHLVEPLGFQMSDKRLQRAGMDYWQQVSRHRWDDRQSFHTSHSGRGRFWLIESAGAKHYAEVQYGGGDFLLFSRESAGLPPKLLAQYPNCWLRIPMFHPASRSLNLANCAAIVLYEGLQQRGFPSECAFPPASA